MKNGGNMTGCTGTAGGSFERRKTMIHWVWLIPAVAFGGMVGMIAMALVAGGTRGEE